MMCSFFLIDLKVSFTHWFVRISKRTLETLKKYLKNTFKNAILVVAHELCCLEITSWACVVLTGLGTVPGYGARGLMVTV